MRPALAQNATWSATPGSDDITAGANWVGGATPTGIGSFGASNTTNLTMSANATFGFFGELAQQGSDLPALLPKGLQLARDNLQRLADAGQDAFGLGLKAGMAIGELARQPFTASPTPPDMAR